MSALETGVSLVVGYLLAVLITILVLPWFGHAVSVGQSVQISAIFTVASVVRSYAIRRIFAGLSG